MDSKLRNDTITTPLPVPCGRKWESRSAWCTTPNYFCRCTAPLFWQVGLLIHRKQDWSPRAAHETNQPLMTAHVLQFGSAFLNEAKGFSQHVDCASMPVQLCELSLALLTASCAKECRKTNHIVSERRYHSHLPSECRDDWPIVQSLSDRDDIGLQYIRTTLLSPSLLRLISMYVTKG